MRKKKEKEKVDQPELIEKVVEQQPEENSSEEEKIVVEVPKKKTSRNSNLHEAKRAKNDEFYTQLTDIEKELKYYKKYFKGKVVLCNCNDAIHGNFAKYFSLSFEALGLKQLICTSYGENAKVFIYNGDKNGNRVPDLEDWEVQDLKGDGDFRSDEMIDLLKKADIVCTNPPFSLFREYIAQLIQFDKKFLIIGNMNSINCKEIFPLIKDNKLWIGPSITSGDRKFNVPDNYSLNAAGCGIDADGKKYIRVKGVRWFTNLDHSRRHQPIDLYKKYTPEEFPKYDNYNAINVDKTCDIPMDYNGVIGVPITFLDKYCPEQFEILGCTQRGCHELVPDTKKYNDFWEVRQDGTKTGSSGNKTNENPNLRRNDGVKNYFINEDGYVVQSLYGRIFIKRKQ